MKTSVIIPKNNPNQELSTTQDRTTIPSSENKATDVSQKDISRRKSVVDSLFRRSQTQSLEAPSEKKSNKKFLQDFNINLQNRKSMMQQLKKQNSPTILLIKRMNDSLKMMELQKVNFTGQKRIDNKFNKEELKRMQNRVEEPLKYKLRRQKLPKNASQNIQLQIQKDMNKIVSERIFKDKVKRTNEMLTGIKELPEQTRVSVFFQELDKIQQRSEQKSLSYRQRIFKTDHTSSFLNLSSPTIGKQQTYLEKIKDVVSQQKLITKDCQTIGTRMKNELLKLQKESQKSEKKRQVQTQEDEILVQMIDEEKTKYRIRSLGRSTQLIKQLSKSEHIILAKRQKLYSIDKFQYTELKEHQKVFIQRH